MLSHSCLITNILEGDFTHNSSGKGWPGRCPSYTWSFSLSLQPGFESQRPKQQHQAKEKLAAQSEN